MMNRLPFNRCLWIMGEHLRPDRYIATNEAQLKGKEASEKEVHNRKVQNESNTVLQAVSLKLTRIRLCASFC